MPAERTGRMLYYLAEGVIKNLDRYDSDVNDRFRRETRRKIKEASCGFNEREEGNYAFVHYIRDEEIRMGLIVENQKKADKQ